LKNTTLTAVGQKKSEIICTAKIAGKNHSMCFYWHCLPRHLLKAILSLLQIFGKTLLYPTFGSAADSFFIIPVVA